MPKQRTQPVLFSSKASLRGQGASRPKPRQQNVLLKTEIVFLLSNGAPLRGQSNGNKPATNFLEMGHHFQAKATATNRTPLRRKQQQQTVLLSSEAPLLGQSNGNNSYLFTGTPRRHQSNGTKSYFLALGHRFGREQIVLRSSGARLQGQRNDEKLYFLALRHCFEANATARNRTS